MTPWERTEAVGEVYAALFDILIHRERPTIVADIQNLAEGLAPIFEVDMLSIAQTLTSVQAGQAGLIERTWVTRSTRLFRFCKTVFENDLETRANASRRKYRGNEAEDDSLSE